MKGRGVRKVVGMFLGTEMIIDVGALEVCKRRLIEVVKGMGGVLMGRKWSRWLLYKYSL